MELWANVIFNLHNAQGNSLATCNREIEGRQAIVLVGAVGNQVDPETCVRTAATPSRPKPGKENMDKKDYEETGVACKYVQEIYKCS